MTLACKGTLIAVTAAAALALTGAAPGATPAKTPPEGGALVTPMDRAGHAIGPSRPAQPAKPRLADRRPSAPLPRAGRRSLQSASGCLQLDVWKNSYSFLFHALVYRWHQVKYWCWSGKRVTTVSVSAYPTNVDPNWYYRGLSESAAWYYRWCCSLSTSGHYSLRQAQMENCVLKFGCIGSEYPWVKIWAHGDGSYSYDWGD